MPIGGHLACTNCLPTIIKSRNRVRSFVLVCNSCNKKYPSHHNEPGNCQKCKSLAMFRASAKKGAVRLTCDTCKKTVAALNENNQCMFCHNKNTVSLMWGMCKTCHGALTHEGTCVNCDLLLNKCASCSSDYVKAYSTQKVCMRCFKNCEHCKASFHPTNKASRFCVTCQDIYDKGLCLADRTHRNDNNVSGLCTQHEDLQTVLEIPMCRQCLERPVLIPNTLCKPCDAHSDFCNHCGDPLKTKDDFLCKSCETKA